MAAACMGGTARRRARPRTHLPPPSAATCPHRSKDHYVADEGDIVFYQKDKDLKLF